MADSTILMTGGSGKLGRLLAELTGADTPLHAQLDVTSESAIHEALQFKTYSTVIHLAAVTSPAVADQKPDFTYRTNVVGTRYVAQAAERCGAKLFYLSSDYVFDGERGDYAEDAVMRPANWYGCTKAAGEMEVRLSGVQYAILRTSFRPHPWGFPTAFTNVYTSADYVDIIAQEVALAISMNLGGIYHIGTSTKTFFELARRRTPEVRGEDCTDPQFPKHRNLNISRWLAVKGKVKVS
jgi:dTDP-4-dehydrorhamnose reductase